MLTIKIKTDNAAFEDHGLVNETLSILDDAMGQIDANGIGRYTLRDSNGNEVGFVSLDAK